MSKHTPGPWFLSANIPTSRSPFRAFGIHAQTSTGMRRNIVNWGGLSSASTPESQANARLIAAAPDLLGVVKAFVEKTDPAILVERDLSMSGFADILRDALTALAKAESEPVK